MEKRMLHELRGEFLMWMKKTEIGRHLLYPSRSHGEERHRGFVQVTTTSWCF